MQHLILLTLFLTLFTSFLANPAPVSIEIFDLFLIAFPFLIGTLCLATTNNYKVSKIESNLFFAIILYLNYLFISSLVGLMHGVPLLNVLRSVGPYLSFFPLLLIGLLPTNITRPTMIGTILISVGLMQVTYLFYLYASHSASNTLGVLINRITLKDPRTTLPILLAVTTLPLFFSLQKENHKQFLLYALSFSLILVGLFAGIVTLTRAIFFLLFLDGFLSYFCIFIIKLKYIARQFYLCLLKL